MIRYSYLRQTLLPHTTYVPQLSPCTTYTLGCQLHYVIFCRDDLLYLMYDGRCLIIGIRVGLVESTSEKGLERVPRILDNELISICYPLLRLA